MLMEMHVIGTNKPESYVIAFDKWLYIGDEDFILSKQNEIIEKVRELYNEGEWYLNFPQPIHYDSLDKLIVKLHSQVFDLFYGYIDGENTLRLYNKLPLNPRHSILFKKVMDNLNFTGVVYVGDEEIADRFSKELIQKSYGYHGTNTNNTPEILRIGIRPNKNSNWSVKHTDKIFFATSLNYSLGHANRSCKYFENKVAFSTLPVIIKFEIPDKAKVIQDFDIENFTGKTEKYDDVDFAYLKNKQLLNKKPLSASREFGLFGYEGVVYPKHIETLLVPKVEEVSRKFNKGFVRSEFYIRNLVEIPKEKYYEYIESVKEYLL
jgi:hypothetical protein